MRNTISLIIPTYNEEGNIFPLIDRVHSVLSGSGITYEIIFIDDNSTDQTRDKVTQATLSYPVKLFTKLGKKGKAYSIFEGIAQAKHDVIVMMDADLQYPPEVLPQMIAQLETSDIVVANRKSYKDSKLRRVMNKTFRHTFGTLLFGLPHDIQSGLKVFKKEAIQTVTFTPRSGWTFDLEFLHRAREAGYSISDYDITFDVRTSGQSKVSSLKSTIEIGSNAIRTRLKRIHPQPIHSKEENSMKGAGVGYKRKQFITHSSLSYEKSALRTFVLHQKIFLTSLFLIFVAGLVVNTFQTMAILVATLSTIYFIDTVFNLYIVLKSLHIPQEITVTDEEMALLHEKSLPVYTILCPMYKEAHIIPSFTEAIEKMDWPKDKLDVILLLEEDDTVSIEAARNLGLPYYMRTVVVPHSKPKTKPKACNYGLAFAKGEYLVIYDAEDIPDPKQLKKAYIAFAKSERSVVCLQAKLNYHNSDQNLLTRFFTAEYSLWFDITLAGLQSLNTALPLGGTSNHFRTEDLHTLQGWDPFNVTEDADLGMRLFKAGYKTALIDSTTLEEANSKVKNWIRQRSRWIKGYMQTYLVHNRDIFTFTKERGVHALFFHLLIGGKIAFILINPFLWIQTVAYFTLYSIVGPTIEALYPPLVFYMAGISLVFGNFLFMYYYMIGCIKREQYSLIKFIFLIPLYWILISIAGFMALYQLFFKPHYWEKTIHGLHLGKVKAKEAEVSENTPKTPEQDVEPEIEPVSEPVRAPRFAYFSKAKEVLPGSTLVIAAVMANLLNFVFNSYLGRTIDLSYFATVSLVSSFLYIVSIPVSGLSSTIKYRSGFLAGKYGNSAAYTFWQNTRLKIFSVGLIVALIWSAFSYILSAYFHTATVLPFLAFAPYIVVSFVMAVDTGYLSGKLLFSALAAIAISEPLIKLGLAVTFITLQLPAYAYLSIPFATVGSFFLGWVLVKVFKETKEHEATDHETRHLPKKFFIASVLSGLASVSFLSFDIILATHFLSAKQAGIYALLSLSGKMVYFLGNLSSQFIGPLVSRQEGASANSKKTLQIIFLTTLAISLLGFVAFGVLAPISLPILFGSRAAEILPYAIFYTGAMLFFTMSRVYNSYYLIKKVYAFSLLSFVLTIVQLVLIYRMHANVAAIVFDMYIVGVLHYGLNYLMHKSITVVQSTERAVLDFFGLFSPIRGERLDSKKLHILIFNWRDTNHKFAGGAEVYVQEIAKRFVKEGANVTMFCGNDGHSSRSQVIDGVNVIRRGGTYLVYFWAFVYYCLRFHGKYDVIIDCENGIPFFTPLYSRRLIFLLVHHVHQEVFREHLRFPLSTIAEMLEGKLMPGIYRNKPVITVSESSKLDLISLGISKRKEITIVQNGINHKEYRKSRKASYPLFSYVGRLKPYKNIDVAIKAFKRIATLYPTARFEIVGQGESMDSLVTLVSDLDLKGKVIFRGKASEEVKTEILGKSWAMIQPSMTEGWGITVIEANACGTPVIASNVHGLKDSVVDGKTGVLVPVKNVGAFFDAMQKIVKGPVYREKLSKQAAVYAKEFSWDKSAETFYQTIIQTLKEQKYSLQNLALSA